MTEKERALAEVQRLPEDATLEDVIERLRVIVKIERGLREIEAGQTIDHEEVKRRILGG